MEVVKDQEKEEEAEEEKTMGVESPYIGEKTMGFIIKAARTDAKPKDDLDKLMDYNLTIESRKRMGII